MNPSYLLLPLFISCFYVKTCDLSILNLYKVEQVLLRGKINSMLNNKISVVELKANTIQYNGKKIYNIANLPNLSFKFYPGGYLLTNNNTIIINKHRLIINRHTARIKIEKQRI